MFELAIRSVNASLKTVGISFAIFAFCALAKIIFSIVYNVFYLGEKFRILKLLRGLVVFLGIGLGAALLTVGVTLLPIAAQAANITVSDALTQTVSPLIIVSIFIAMASTYAADAAKAFLLMIKSSSTVDKIVAEATDPPRDPLPEPETPEAENNTEAAQTANT